MHMLGIYLGIALSYNFNKVILSSILTLSQQNYDDIK